MGRRRKSRRREKLRIFLWILLLDLLFEHGLFSFAGFLNTNLTNYSNAMRVLLGFLNTNLTNLSNAMRGTWQGLSSTNLANARGTPPNQNNPLNPCSKKPAVSPLH